MNKYGFTLIEERDMPETGGIARLWKHGKSGAELLSVNNSDQNKCFGVSFYTPPANSTGVAHILEHSVLCGSDKYPVKEPFVELLKGSLQTFLNAFTFPDKTCYPVASANLADFYNLVDVYLDAVFHPLLTENIFRQEGWHVETESAESPWFYKGVVYNEMKGVYSSAESMLAEQSQQAVFPDNIYSLDSGGNPEVIPELSFNDFRQFHATRYQPGNARFFFWGDDPEDERLRIISEAIGNTGSAVVLPEVNLQKFWREPRYIEKTYAASENEDRALFTLNWLLPERADVEQALVLEMLEHILEGLPGSALRRALMESGLGEDTVGMGLETDLRQMFYSTGLKGIEPKNVAKAQELILSTLRELAENGIDQQAIEAAVNSVEFAYRESNTGRFPRGLAAMIQGLSTWLYGGNPLDALAWEKPLARIKQRLANGEKVFENAIKDNFLNNTHRVTVTLLPDKKLAEKRITRESERLEQLRAASDLAGREKLAKETEELMAAQLAPDNPADLAKIPSLKISDLPRKNAEIPMQVEEGKQTIITHALPANGVLYANLLLPVEKLPKELVPMLPLFARAMTELGTGTLDYTEFGKMIAAKTGGLGVAPLTGAREKDGAPYFYLSLPGKAVSSHIDDLFDLYRMVLADPQKDSQIILQRLKQMTLEEKARLEYGLQAAGHAAVMLRLRARHRPENALQELMGGITQLQWLREFEKRLESEPEKVLADFNLLREMLLASNGAILDLTGDREDISRARAASTGLFDSMPETAKSVGVKIAELGAMDYLPRAEAFITQGQVNYVGKGGNVREAGYMPDGSEAVIMRWLRMGKLWEEVRVAGGAYGAFCALDRIGGNLVYASYRDPNVEKTIAAYDGIGAYLRGFQPTNAQLSQAIIGAVGDVDAYLLPDAKGAKALGWYLNGTGQEERQTRRERMLSTTARDFNNFAEIADAIAKNGEVSVIGGARASETASKLGWAATSLN